MQTSLTMALATIAVFLSGCFHDEERSEPRTDDYSSDSDVPTLRPDLPDSTSLRFSLRIDLNIGDPETLFVPALDDLKKAETTGTTLSTVSSWLITAEDSGMFSPELFVDVGWISNQEEYNAVSRTINSINPQTVWWQYLRGKRLRFFPAEDGVNNDTLKYEFVPSFTPVVHGPASFFLVDHYMLSNFVGDYGTGRIVNTFSLLPGETTELRVSTYRDESISSRFTTSILDSSSSETTDSFLEVLGSTTTTDQTDQSSNTNASFKAEGSYSALSTSAKASTTADINKTSNSRREFHNDVASSVSTTANRASASRDVYVDTNVESTVEQGREDISVRTISNINTGHTLNFISYQMNQEYHSILHLTGVEIGFDDGFGNVVTVPLYQLDRLVDTFVVEGKQENVRRAVLSELTTIIDYKGESHAEFILPNPAPASTGELTDQLILNADVTYSVNYNYLSSYTVNNSNTELSVPGIIVDIQPVVMRTDGIYVESLVGQNSAWDSYTKRLMEKKLKDD